jgi:hypothetical protein
VSNAGGPASFLDTRREAAEEKSLMKPVALLACAGAAALLAAAFLAHNSLSLSLSS